MTNEITTSNASLTSNDLVFSPGSMREMNAVAQVMSEGIATVPKHLQKKPADCLAIVMQAVSWNMNPYQVAQKTHLVNGTLGYEAQLLNAVVSSSTAIVGRFHYEYGGAFASDKDPDSWVKVGAQLRGEDHIQWGEPLYPATVGVKNSPLWKTNPKQQSSYLALKYWARLYAPAVILGVYSCDEIRDFQPEKEIQGETIKDLRPETSPELDDFGQSEPSVSIDDVLQSIAKADSLEALRNTQSIANGLSSDDLKNAQIAYNEKGKQIQAESEKVDTDQSDEKPEYDWDEDYQKAEMN